MLQDFITIMKAESQRLWATAQLLERLAKKYPGLWRHTDRWDRVRYCSLAVNGRVNRIEVGHNCGCCDDSPLEIWPYLEDDGPEQFRIHSTPPCFRPGKQNAGGTGEVPNLNWEDEFRRSNISQAVIEQVGDYLEHNPPQDFGDDE